MVKVRVLMSGLGILLLLAVIGIMLGYTGGQDNESGSPRSTRVTGQPGDTVQQVLDLLTDFTLDDLILHSDAIVIGRVTDILPAKRGVLPGEISIIYTDVIVEADRYLYGGPKSERIAIRVWGGRIGNTVMLVEDEAVFTLGEHIVVFLARAPYEVVSPDGIDPLSYYQVTGTCLGKFAYRCRIAYQCGIACRFPCKIMTICAIEKKVAEIKGGWKSTDPFHQTSTNKPKGSTLFFSTLIVIASEAW